MHLYEEYNNLTDIKRKLSTHHGKSSRWRHLRTVQIFKVLDVYMYKHRHTYIDSEIITCVLTIQ